MPETLRRILPIVNRAGQAMLTLVGVSILSFLLLRVMPGDPVGLILGRLAPEEAIAAQTKAMGLDQPLYIQYSRYVGDFVQGDWGFSYSSGSPVSTLIGQRLPATLELAGLAFIIATVSAVVIGLFSTLIDSRLINSVANGLSHLGLGTPPFWLALVALVVLSQRFDVLPGPEGRLSLGTGPPPDITGLYTVDALLSLNFSVAADAFMHLILPATVLAFAPFAFLLRLLRANLTETASEPFVLLARARGNSRFRTYLRHVLPNAILPTLTIAGIMLAELAAGSVLVEEVFAWPGLGKLMIDAIGAGDFTVVQTFILLSACLYVAVNATVDVLYRVIDPRISADGMVGA